MRFDNPIAPDWFGFPDLADFPDYANEERNDAYYDYEFLEQALAIGNIGAFMGEVKRLTGDAFWMDKLHQSFHKVRRTNSEKPRSADSIVTDCGTALYDKGIYITSIDFCDLGVELLVSKLLANEDWSPQPGTYDRGTFLNAEQTALVAERFRQAGILDGVAEYSNKRRSVTNVFLHVSTPTDKHYKQFFMDATTTPKWTNLHIDPKEDVIKAIVYLNDIGPDNGGFGYVPESNRFRYPTLMEVFGRAITTGNYCRTPEERKSVFALPKWFRISYNFGRCVLDDSYLSKELDRRFLRVTSDMGNVAVFDAGAGMHQGGLVKEGKRVSLQVLMK